MDSNTDQHGNVYTNVNLNTQPDPVTNAPGLTLLFGPTTEHDSGWQFVLYDANGSKLASGYAEFDPDPDPDPDDDGRSLITNRPHGWHAVRTVAFDSGWGVLSVCPQPEPDQESDVLPLGQSVSFRHAKDGTLLDTTYTVSHSHPHEHNRIPGGPHSHAHPHTRYGVLSTRSWYSRHGDDPHDHDHDH